MKLCDLVNVMGNQGFITLVMNVSGVIFEADVKITDIPIELAALDIARVYAHDNQVTVLLDK